MRKEKKSQLTMKIDSISIKKNKVICVIDSKEYSISLDTFSNSYLYPNKEITKEELSTFILDNKLIKSKNYVKDLLSKSRYTYSDIKKKLIQKYKLDEKEIKSIIKPYLEEGIIDDYQYALDYIQSKNNKCYGKNYFIRKLKLKGIDSSILDKSEIKSALDYNNQFISTYIPLLLNKVKNKPSKAKKVFIKNNLLNRGFDSSLINYEIDKITLEDSEEVVQNLAKKADSIYKQLKKKDIPEGKIKEKMIQKLLYYGYNYENILSYLSKILK